MTGIFEPGVVLVLCVCVCVCVCVAGGGGGAVCREKPPDAVRGSS